MTDVKTGDLIALDHSVGWRLACDGEVDCSASVPLLAEALADFSYRDQGGRSAHSSMVKHKPLVRWFSEESARGHVQHEHPGESRVVNPDGWSKHDPEAKAKASAEAKEAAAEEEAKKAAYAARQATALAAARAAAGKMAEPEPTTAEESDGESHDKHIDTGSW